MTNEQKLETAWMLIDAVYGSLIDGSDVRMKLLDIKNEINNLELEEEE